MTRIDDETLMAYADGTLDDAKSAAVERQLALDPEARRTVEMFRQTSSLARDAFSDALTAEPPKALVDMILSHPIGANSPAPEGKTLSEPSRTERGTVVPFDRLKRLNSRRSSPFALPLAASLALMVGIGAGYFIWRQPFASQTSEQFSLGPVGPNTVLARILETKHTGETFERTLVVATFRDRNGRVCREVEQFGPGPIAERVGVVCRQPGGEWIVEGAARVATPAARPESGIVPSGADEKDALASLLTMLGAKPVMTPDEEKVLLDRGWK